LSMPNSVLDRSHPSNTGGHDAVTERQDQGHDAGKMGDERREERRER